jgi:two-component system sensor histidine kinase RegB
VAESLTSTLPPAPRDAAAIVSERVPDSEAQRINFAWLVRLRWSAVVGQLVTVLLVDFGMHIAVPRTPLLAVIGTEAASNVACMLWARHRAVVGPSTIGALLAFDIVLLSVLLFLSGGPFNPFSFLYLVHVALAAVVLPAAWTWGLVALALASFGALFVQHDWLPSDVQAHMSHADQMRMHMQGMWIAFGVAAVFISYFVTRVRQSLAQRESELMRARALASRSEKLASLATLATGAAHELSTPLSTIAVVAKELERALTKAGAQAQSVSDAQLIRREVDRCRDILQLMATDAGHSSSEGFSSVSVAELIESALQGLPRREQVSCKLNAETARRVLRAQPQATAQALRSVLKNALQASPAGETVAIDARVVNGSCRIEVRDRGPGMVDDVLTRAGEPFFTTKEPGEGMGLGLFLSRMIIERIGGRIELHSRAGAGTTAVVSIPVAAAPSLGGTPAEHTPEQSRGSRAP